MSKPMTTILPTRNPDWGFWNTVRERADQDEAWREASEQIATATGGSPEGVRDFLDSRLVRHFADDVGNGLHAARRAGSAPILERAIADAIERWTGWTITRRDERERGIPQGLPMLTGWVTHFEIMAEPEGVA